MLFRLEIPLSCQESLQFSPSWGSLLHGALMELLSSETATQLHVTGPKPLAQHLYREASGQVIWVVTALNEAMTTELSSALIKRLPLEIKLVQKSASIQLAEPRKTERTTYRELADKHFQASEVNRQHKIRLVTPTSFKTAGKHVIFPTTDLIMNSLMQRWDANADDLSLFDPDVREHLGNHVSIKDYRLASASFSVNGSWLKGFSGRLDLGVSGPEALVRVASLLIDFGRFSGVGVKTALGMGGLQID
jgi:CRISPR-associated endoribonuclease Cas6